MADPRNVKHLKKTKGPEAVQELTAPSLASKPVSKGRRGHMAAGENTVSSKVLGNIRKKDRTRLFGFDRPRWRHRRNT